MIPKKRIRLSALQRVEVWRWKAGESSHAIGRTLGKNNVVIHLLLKRHGGISAGLFLAAGLKGLSSFTSVGSGELIIRWSKALHQSRLETNFGQVLLLNLSVHGFA